MSGRSKNLLTILSFVCIAGLFSACSAPTTPAPVQPFVDVQAIRTEAAMTIVADITNEALKNPTATIVVPTLPPPPPASPTAPVPTAEPLAPIPTNTTAPSPQPTSTVSPTKTKVVYLPTIARSDQALLMIRTPKEYAQFSGGETFDAVWTLKNVGKKTWTNEYYLQYFNGTELHYNGSKRFVSGDVAPGEQTSFTVDMKAPSSPGTYTTSWVFFNDNGAIFGQYFLTIVVK